MCCVNPLLKSMHSVWYTIYCVLHMMYYILYIISVWTIWHTLYIHYCVLITGCCILNTTHHILYSISNVRYIQCTTKKKYCVLRYITYNITWPRPRILSKQSSLLRCVAPVRLQLGRLVRTPSCDKTEVSAPPAGGEGHAKPLEQASVC
jgi:hypothetical protein